MRLTPLDIDGVYLLELDLHRDGRGYFARTYCEETFKSHGLWQDFPQHNISFNIQKGTVRGMHYQRSPYEEVKVVRCVQGAIDDVIVDLRPGSSTYLQSLKVELSAQNGQALYIPTGLAHGFQSLEENTLVYYLMGCAFQPDANTGFRWDDPSFKIEWRLPISQISDRDRSYPLYRKNSDKNI